MRYFFAFTVLLGLFFWGTMSSCNKQILLSKSNLAFSTDTLVFDTVFTTIGSTTQSFKIYNPDQRSLKIEEVELMGGENSVYRINVDGTPGAVHKDLLLEAKDSLFIFVELTLQANNSTNPLII